MEMINESISLHHVSVIIVNSKLINTDIILYGSKNESVNIRNCTFRGTEIVIDSFGNCTMESCNFEAEDIPMGEESRHMIRVHNLDFLHIYQTKFAKSVLDDDNAQMSNTQLGIQMENVSLADITRCTFRNLKSDMNNGSVLLLTSSEVHIRQSRFVSNVARNGVIYATSNVHITNGNSSFIGNFAEGCGSVIYMANNSILKNSYCIMHDNSAKKVGGALYMERFVNCFNYETSFTNNRAQAGGGVIFAKTIANITNVKCVFSGNGVGDRSSGGAIYANDHVVTVNLYSTYHNNTAFSGGALTIRSQVNVSFVNCTVSNNDARNDGGALSLLGEAEISIQNSTYIHNVAEQGAVISVMSDEEQGHVTTKIVDSSFYHNSADYGGVVYILGFSDISIINSKFNKNTGIFLKKNSGKKVW